MELTYGRAIMHLRSSLGSLCQQWVTVRAHEVCNIATEHSFQLCLDQWKQIWQESTALALRTVIYVLSQIAFIFPPDL